jgi:hypothetical protein
VTLFDDPDAEERIFGQLERNRTQQAYYYSAATSDLADLIGANASQYPWLKPGANLSLSQAGLGPDHPVTRRVAHTAAKKKVGKGFGWHSIGDVVNATGKGIGGAAKAVGGGVASVAKPVVRGVFTGLESGYQELQGAARTAIVNVAGAGHVRGPSTVAAQQQTKSPLQGEGFVGPQSTGGIALEHLVRGEKVDLGTGFLPGGEVAKEQAARARQSAMIDGHALTPGRLFAHAVAEPDTTPYNILSGLVDGAAAIYADPAAVGLGKVSDLREARKLFTSRKLLEAAGGVKGVRPAVMTDVAEAWLSTKDGRKVVDFIAGESNWDNLWKTFKKKIPVDVINELTDARTADEVKAVLRPVLGVEVREQPYMANAINRSVKPVGGWGVSIRKRMDGVRLLQTMPGSHIDLNDLDGAVETLDRFQKNAKLPAEIVARNNEALARSADRIAAYDAVAKTMTDVSESIPNVAKGQARKMTQMFTNYSKEYAKYFVDEIGENVAVPGAMIDGAGHALPSPHLYVEYLNGTLPLPNAREIKRATSFLAPAWKVPGVDKSVALLDAAQQNIWKPFVLLRGAWTVRVVGEEQVRMAGSGLDSIFSHPLSAISRLVSDEGIGAKGLEKVGLGARGHLDMLGEQLSHAEEAQRALSRGTMGFRDTGVIRTKYKTLYEKGVDNEFAHAWGEEIAQLSADPVARQVASTPSLEDTKAWFWDGSGQKFRKEMAQASGKNVLLDRTGADQYVDSVFNRVKIKTADQSELIDAIATGRHGDEVVSDGSRLSKKLVKRLREMEASDIGPVKVKGDLTVAVRNATGSYDKAVESLFNTLMSKPTNYLSRSKAFEQFYWKRSEELIGYLDPEAQAKVLANARAANLSRGQLKQLAKNAERATGDLTTDHADTVAKAFALDSTRALLYDISEKSQWADASRLVMPFAEAWKEILTRWARIGVENPKILRRGQQVVQGARGAGFFYKSPQTGEESFVYPGSAFITDKLMGVPTPLEGSVSGLNLFSQSVLPGFGPVVQLPAAKLIPDRPEWDEFRKLVIPYGEAQGPFPQNLLPAWAKNLMKWWNSPESDRAWNNTVFDVATYLKSNGDYDTSTEEGIDKLMTDATKKAKTLYLIRGLSQFVAPTSPQPLEQVKDKDGRLHAIRALSDEFHALEEKDGYQEAIAHFLDKYGDGVSFVLQPKTEGGSPATADALDFVREHPEVARKYPEVYGYFAPQGGEFDFAAYERQLASGERKPISPSEAAHRGNARVAQAIYQQAKSKMPEKPSKSDREWLGRIRDLLVQKYPGYEPTPVDMGKTDRKIRALQELADDPAVAETDAAAGLKLYLAAREKALDSADNLGLSSFAQAKKAQAIRDWLRNIGDLITQAHPDFAPMYEQVFDREMKKDAA